MNTSAAVRHTRRRAARFNSWAAVVVLAAFAVLAVKAQASREQNIPTRHFQPATEASAECYAMRRPLDCFLPQAGEKP